MEIVDGFAEELVTVEGVFFGLVVWLHILLGLR